MFQLSVVVIIVLVALLFIAIKGGIFSGLSPSYCKAGPLFTPAEQNFMRALDRAVGSDVRVFGKVRVADVLAVKPGVSSKGNWNAFAKITGKHFDYVLCGKSDFVVKCVIELNDKSHERKDRQERDRLIRGACKEAGMPLIEVPAARTYDIQKLKNILLPYIN